MKTTALAFLLTLSSIACSREVRVESSDGSGGSGSSSVSSGSSTATSSPQTSSSVSGTPSTCQSDNDCYPPPCWAASCVGDPSKDLPAVCEYAQARDGLACDLSDGTLGACGGGFCK